MTEVWVILESTRYSGTQVHSVFQDEHEAHIKLDRLRWKLDQGYNDNFRLERHRVEDSSD